jgi:hypothetical protein
VSSVWGAGSATAGLASVSLLLEGAVVTGAIAPAPPAIVGVVVVVVVV